MDGLPDAAAWGGLPAGNRLGFCPAGFNASNAIAIAWGA